MPAFPLQERRDSLSKSFLHIDDGAVLVEREYFDFAPQDVGRFHRVSLQLREALTICGMSARGLGRVKTKSDLVVMRSGGQIFAFFCSPHDRRAQNSGC